VIRIAFTLAATLAPLLAQTPPKRVAPLVVLAAPAPVARVSQGLLDNLEKAFDMRLFPPIEKDPLDPLGSTRAVYLDGYGIVFTTELMLLVTTNESPFQPTIPEALKQQIHERKLVQLGKLQDVMKQLVKMAATTLAPMSDDQKIVYAVRVRYYMWENTAGLPAQIKMSADKKAALMGDIKTEIE
jgi:hypothetical protein